MRDKNRQNGFTLLETVISLLIVSLVTIQIFLVAQNGSRAALLSEQRLQGYFLAQKQKETIRGVYLDANKNWDNFFGALSSAPAPDNTCTKTDTSCSAFIDWNGTKTGFVAYNSGSGRVVTINGTGYTVLTKMEKKSPGGTDEAYRKWNIIVSWTNPFTSSRNENVTMDYYLTDGMD